MSLDVAQTPMNDGADDVGIVLAAYPSERQPHRVQPLGAAGGFSGARFWKLESPSGPLCLRRWPSEHPAPDRLEFIQAVLWHADQQGFHLVPVPCETQTHAGYVRHRGHLWELSPWMPGEADFQRNPTPTRLAAAVEALAEFHLAGASFPLPHPQPTLSPGILERRHELKRLLDGGIGRLAASIEPDTWPDLARRAEPLLRLFYRTSPAVLHLLDEAAGKAAPVVPCLRDIWHDHVLYTGPRVSGLVDFGAMRPDSVATDLARLLGSLAGDDPALWRVGLAAYRAVRPLSAAEQLLVTAFDRSGVLLAGIHWLRWHFEEGRRFEARDVVIERVDAVLRRLEHLADELGAPSWLEFG